MRHIRTTLLALLICIFSTLMSPVAPKAGDVPRIHKLGSMLMLGFRGATLDGADQFLQMIADGKIGNIILFDKDMTDGSPRNIVSPEQLKKLTRILREAAPRPIFIAVDQEGGQVRRLKPAKGFYDVPSAQAMGQGNATATFEIADALGQELTSLGINMDLAPVVDVDSNPFNPAIGRLGRSFGTEAANVARHALAFGRGLAKNGVIPTLKHFPGQGCAAQDSHIEFSDITQCWNPEVDLLPYADILSRGWPGAIMTGHVFQKKLDEEQPATFSRNIITGLLRNGLGWQGVVISDDLQMKAATSGRDLKEIMQLALDAGVDILLLGNNLEWNPDLPMEAWEALEALYNEGTLTDERIEASWQRISALHHIKSDKP